MSERTFATTIQRPRMRARRFRVAALIVVLAAAGVVGRLALHDTESTKTSTSNATAASVSDLATLATSVAHPVFWLGPKPGFTYELTRLSNGSVFIRYLPEGADVGTKTPYLTVATYPFNGAYAAIRNVVQQHGTTSIRLANNGLAETSPKSPTSVHIAYPGVDYQVEVYDPTTGEAEAAVRSGRLAHFGSLKQAVPVAANGAIVATPARLKALAKTLGHPIYWAGAKQGYTYEWRQISDGQVYIRYLPSGTAVGATGQYLTVGTYPFTNAYDATKALATQQKARTLELDGGGIAVLDKRHPKSIHIAYPGSDHQIEVFATSPAAALHVVAAGEVTSIG